MNAPLSHKGIQPAGIRLADRAMIATVTIRQWSGRKLDRAVTEETNRSHGAEHDAGRFNKLLVAKERLRPIEKIAGKARNSYYWFTAPWLDSGGRILPAAGYDRFMSEMSTLRQQFDHAAGELVRDYAAIVEESRSRLGSMFSESDYPLPSDIARRFDFSIGILPLPSAGDFRIDIPDGDAIRAQIEARTNEAIEAAMRDSWERIAETVGAMAERLAAYQPGGPDGRAQNVFRDSLVENLRNLVGILPGLNLTGSPAMARITELMEQHLCEHDAETLRTDNKARGEVARKAAKIREAISAFM